MATASLAAPYEDGYDQWPAYPGDKLTGKRLETLASIGDLGLHGNSYFIRTPFYLLLPPPEVPLEKTLGVGTHAEGYEGPTEFVGMAGDANCASRTCSALLAICDVGYGEEASERKLSRAQIGKWCGLSDAEVTHGLAILINHGFCTIRYEPHSPDPQHKCYDPKAKTFYQHMFITLTGRDPRRAPLDKKAEEDPLVDQCPACDHIGDMDHLKRCRNCGYIFPARDVKRVRAHKDTVTPMFEDGRKIGRGLSKDEPEPEPPPGQFELEEPPTPHLRPKYLPKYPQPWAPDLTAPQGYEPEPLDDIHVASRTAMQAPSTPWVPPVDEDRPEKQAPSTPPLPLHLPPCAQCGGHRWQVNDKQVLACLTCSAPYPGSAGGP